MWRRESARRERGGEEAGEGQVVPPWNDEREQPETVQVFLLGRATATIVVPQKGRGGGRIWAADISGYATFFRPFSAPVAYETKRGPVERMGIGRHPHDLELCALQGPGFCEAGGPVS